MTHLTPMVKLNRLEAYATLRRRDSTSVEEVR